MPREQLSDVVSELVANVLEVLVEPDAHLDAGDEVALLESMKMEIPVVVEHPGTVVAVKVAPGDVVQDGDVIVTLRLDD